MHVAGWGGLLTLGMRNMWFVQVQPPPQLPQVFFYLGVSEQREMYLNCFWLRGGHHFPASGPLLLSRRTQGR